MSEAPEYKDIIKALMNGAYDDQIEELRDAIDTRVSLTRDIYATEMKTELSIGNRVVLKDISPKYLVGCAGEYKGFKNRSTKYAEVKMDENFRAKTRSGKTIGIPWSCIEREETT